MSRAQLYFKFLFLWLTGLSNTPFVLSQNLVLNPDFEEYTACPFYVNNGWPLECIPWQSPTLGTPDYYHVCATNIVVGVPNNFGGYQEANTGSAYGGFILKSNFTQTREYLQVQLSESLIANETYNVFFYVSLADYACAISKIGAYFSENPPLDYTIYTELNVTPQIESDLGFLNDQENWMLISGCYTAQGGEQWITIGNFYNDLNSPFDPSCSWPVTHSYYYIDDVSVIYEDNSVFDLGDSVFACDFYEIDPGLSDVNFLWDDGSTDPTRIVTESGIYSLTISTSCFSATDSLEVIIDPLDVDIGPSEVTICNGESYDVSLNPLFGNYEWQDGSNDADYSITVSGIYQVTLDDGCDLSTDMVIVSVIDPPAFDLGGDAILCPGDEIVFSFDPEIGDYEWQDGSTSSTFTIEMGGLYSLTIINMCGEVSDDIEVIDVIPPEIDLGADQKMICDGQFIDFDLNPDLGDYLWQDGSTSSSYSISVPGAYSVTVSNECGISSDDLEVLIMGEPVFDLGQDIMICPAQLPITLDVSEATNATSFLWSDNSTGSQFQVTGAGIFSVTVSNACFSITDSIYITVEDADVLVTLPVDLSICPGQSLLLMSGGTVGNYLWQDSSNSATFLVDQEGTYSLTVTNQCGSGSDSISVNYTDTLSEFSLGQDVSLCPGEQYIFYAGIPGASYTWQDMSTADSLVVTLPGTYSLQISNMCDTIADTVMVVVNDNPPVVSLPSSVDLCSGEVITIDAGITGVQYLWNDGSQLSSISVSAPGTYSITVSNSCGADTDTVVIVDAGPAPVVSLNTDLFICPGEVIVLSPVSADVVTWLWHDGSTGSTYNVSSPGIVSVEVNNNCGSDSDSVIVSLLPAPPALDLGPDTTFCPGEIITFSINIPDINILWPDGSSDPDYSVTSAGPIYATISNQCGAASDSLDVILLPPAPMLNLGNDQSLCPGETINFSPGISGVNYFWQDGSTSAFYNATQPGLIILYVSNSCGTAVDTLEIIVDTDGPELDLGDDVLACEGDLVTLNASISGVSYLWQDGSTQPYFSTDVSGTFILIISNACGQDADTVIVDLSGKAPTPSLGPDTMFCEGFTFQLHSDADDDSNITWQDGSTLPILNVSSPGTYILSESNRCGMAADTIVIAIESPPLLFDLGPDTILCPGESILLFAPSTTDLITWQDGSHGTSIIADQEKTYSLQLSNVCGTAEDELSVSFDDKVLFINIDPLISMCPDEIITLEATQDFIASYLWSTGSTLPSLQVNTPGTYAINVTTPCQSVQQDIEVISDEDCHHDIYIPNVFSPNGDDVNDVFTISYSSNLNVVSVNCSIFDRWGNNVFQSDDIHFNWDGRFRDQLLQPGVYVYQISVDYMVRDELQNKVFVDDITLLR